MIYNIDQIIITIDDYLRKKRKKSCSTAEAGRELRMSGFVLGTKLWGDDEDYGKAVRDMIYNGDIPYAYKDGRVWRIPKSPEGYVQKLQNTMPRKRVTGSTEDLLYGMGICFGIPLLIIGLFVLFITNLEPVVYPELEEYKARFGDWADGLDTSIPANQLIHYDIETGTAVYGPPKIFPPPITQEEYEANAKRYQPKTIIRDGENVYELNISKDELIEQVMDDLDLLDYYEEYVDW